MDFFEYGFVLAYLNWICPLCLEHYVFLMSKNRIRGRYVLDVNTNTINIIINTKFSSSVFF